MEHKFDIYLYTSTVKSKLFSRNTNYVFGELMTENG